MDKLKNKIQIYRNYFNLYISQESFKYFYIYTIIITIYGGLLIKQETNIISGIPNLFKFSTFLLCYYTLIILNSMSLNNFYENMMTFYNIRKGSKKSVLKSKIFITIIVNLYYNLIIYLLLITFVSFFSGGNINNVTYHNYDISNYTYLFYIIIRNIIITTFISIINITLYEKIKLKCIVIDVLFLLGIIINSIKNNLKLSINIFEVVKVSNFNNVKYDIGSTIICLLILLLIEIILFKTIYREKKNEIPDY